VTICPTKVRRGALTEIEIKLGCAAAHSGAARRTDQNRVIDLHPRRSEACNCAAAHFAPRSAPASRWRCAARLIYKAAHRNAQPAAARAALHAARKDTT
jgi:hypothetical protein